MGSRRDSNGPNIKKTGIGICDEESEREGLATDAFRN